MATFVPREPMPTALKALQAKVLKNHGLHFKFPYGVVADSTTGGALWRNNIPDPFYVGLTARAFFYAPPVGDTHNYLRVYYNTPHTNNVYQCGGSIRGTTVIFENSGSGPTATDRSDPTNINIDIPGYYSFAVRMKGTKYFALHYNDGEVGQIYIDPIFGRQWELIIYGRNHHLLSLHLSDELEANADFPATALGQRYYMHDPIAGVGSFWVMRCLVIDTAKSFVVYLDVDTNIQEPFFFPLTNVKVTDVVTVYIRKTRGSWLVSTSFHPKTQRVDSSYAAWPNRIYPTVSFNAVILHQFCEPGPP